LFERAATMDDVARLSADLAGAVGFDVRELKNLGLGDRRVRLFLALGRGSQLHRGPFKLTLRQSALAMWLPELGWPENPQAFDLGIVPAEM
ncbi:hypothetical protein ACP3VW_19820, partial [Vibrio sp. DNB22_17_1]